jgi:hypothetical protein
MFDVKQEIVIPVLNRDVPGGQKTCRVRWPEDPLWVQYNASIRLETKPRIGNLGSVSEAVGVEEASATLYKAIVLEESHPFDSAEQVEVIERLGFAELRDVRRHGSAVEFTIAVPGDVITKHKLYIPTAREQKDYQKSLPDVVDLGKGRSTLCMDIEPHVRYYDLLFAGASGYAEGQRPPAPHKIVAISALREIMREAARDTDFFSIPPSGQSTPPSAG